MRKTILGFGIAVLLFGLVMRRTNEPAVSKPSPENQPGRAAANIPRALANFTEPPEKLSDDAMRTLCRCLQQWRERKTGDVAAEAHLVEEWCSLLDGVNAGDVMRSLSDEERAGPLGHAALERWLSVAPEEALRWMSSRPTASRGESLLAIRKMLETPERLASFCDGLPAGEWKQDFLAAAGQEALRVDRNVALELAQRLDAGAVRNDLLQTIAYEWIGQDAPAATAWIQSLDDAGLRDRLLTVTTKALALTDPDLAVRWLNSAVADPQARAAKVFMVVEIWSHADIAKTAGWVAQFPAGPLRTDSVECVARQWLQSDPFAAWIWLQQLPEGTALTARLQAEADERARVVSLE